MNTAKKTGLDAAKTTFKKSIKQPKQFENWQVKKLLKNVKTKPVPHENSKNIEEIVIRPEKRQEMSSNLRQVL